MNKQGGGLSAPALTAKDMEDIKTAMSFQADYVAVSFPRTPPTWKWRASCATWRPPSSATPACRQDRACRGHPEARRDPARERRHHGRARRPRGRGGQRGRAGAAEEDDPHGARDGQGGHHRHADDGVDDHQPGAHARRGERRGQRGARRHRRGDALGRDRLGPLSAGDGAGDEPHLRGRRSRRGPAAGRRLQRPDLQPHRPVDRHGRALHRDTTWAPRRSSR